MADLTAPVPGPFDAQAPGLTAASGTAPQKLEDDIQALEQQLADLQVMSEIHLRALRRYLILCLSASKVVVPL